MKNEKYISDRISFFDHGTSTSIVISSKINRLKETMLLFWILCWSACGIYLVYELVTGNHDDKMQIGLFIFISFWVYFEYRITRVFLWRKWGMEFMRVDDEEFSYKISVGRFGKASRFYFDSMGPFRTDKDVSKSFAVNIEDSFWFVGGEKIQFEYRNKQYKIGRQLSEKECKDLIRLIQKQQTKHQNQVEKAKLKTENQSS